MEESLAVLSKLEKKQEKAREAVSSYESFLAGMESLVSPELYGVFAGELEIMKFYTGMEKQGYYVPVMRQTVENNLSILQGFSFGGFSKRELGRVRAELEQVAKGMQSYSADGLWFTYGEIVVAKENGADVVAALAELLTTGILELVGVPKDKQSDCRLTGVDLPSASLEGESFFTDLLSCISEVENMFVSGDMGDLLKKAGNALLDTTALELYGMKYFRCFLDQSEVTKLKYEREYLVFGAKKDKTNLLCMVVYLTAIRTLFSMVSIVKQPEKMAAIQSFAAGIAGCTGIPLLLSVIKYALLLLWSVEEALVEVAAMLLGKKIPILGKGTFSMEELLTINKSVIAGKAQALPEGVGPGYKEYLALLSLTKSIRKKTYRAMDLIQENIRYRYRDSFRMRNVVTELDFSTSSKLKQLYASERFFTEMYQLEWKEHCAY